MVKRKTIVYIDGFNLYYGIKEKYAKRFIWLNIETLSNEILQKNQQLEGVKYFTARINNNTSKRQKQNSYLEALNEITNVKMFFGRYQNHEMNCKTCNATWSVPKEKKTDVNIAIQMTAVAFLDNFDDALLITRDSDLVPPIEIIKQHFVEKRIGLAISPGLISRELIRKVDYSFYLSRKVFKENQLPAAIEKSNGFMIKKPTNWI